MKRILFVDFQYNYGIKERGLHLIGEHGFKRAFLNLGFEVENFYFDDYLDRIPQLQKDLIQKTTELKPDYVFFQLFEDQFLPTTLDHLKSITKTINWFGDDTWRFDNFSSKYAPHFSYVVTTDKFAVPKYKKMGVNHVIESQWAAMESETHSFDGKYKYDVSFVGQCDPFRKWFVRQLNKFGLEVACFGHGWDDSHLSGEEMAELFVRSKINLNLGNSVCYDVRFLSQSLIGTLKTLRGKKNKSQIKARNFEINWGGGFQLTDWVPSLNDYYVIGKEIDCYSTPAEAADLIKYYLENDAEREKIKDAGVVRARSEHSYTHRLEKVFQQIEKGSNQTPSDKTNHQPHTSESTDSL